MAPKRPPPHLTPQQIALSEARKAKKLKETQQTDLTPSHALVDQTKGKIKERPWISLIKPQTGAKYLKVSTWNLLAQCLVRRELFPTSTCLKAAQREHMIYNEILLQDADILCLQEVDRLDRLLPVLEKAGYGHHYASGPGKKHGCLIAFKKVKFGELHSRVVHYDQQDVRDDPNEVTRRGASFRTKNIGLICAIRDQSGQSGVVVATTHLFWHPRYTYERARQAGILKREVFAFRTECQLDNWPCIISGDFNFAPDDAAYSLMVGDPLLPAHKVSLQLSQVVHATIDPSISSAVDGATVHEEDGDPDKVITNARRATESDGLLCSSELTTLFGGSPPMQSAYDTGLRDYKKQGGALTTFGDRASLSAPRKGVHEPEWTSYTQYWKTVLDYIFFFDVQNRVSVSRLLTPHCSSDLEPGLPQDGVCGSDHVLLSAELAISAGPPITHPSV